MWQINVNKIRINNIVRVFIFFFRVHAVSVLKDDLGIGVFIIGILRRAARVDLFTFFGLPSGESEYFKDEYLQGALHHTLVCTIRFGGVRVAEGSSLESCTYVSRAWLDAWTTDNGSSPATNTNHEPLGWMRGAPRWHGKGSDRPHPTRRDHAQSTRWASWGWGSTDP